MSAPGASQLALRGTIEGFYGPPWTHEQRLAQLRFSADAGFNTFVYAPKDDPYHRLRWREPYPPDDLAKIAELAAAADALGLRFVYALHPATSMRFSDDAEHAALADKAGQLHDAGVRAFALLFDDVPLELADARDVELYGAGAGGCGAAHGATCRRLVEAFLAPRGLGGPLLVCPTDYAGVDASPYRDRFAETAPDDVLITWTGSDVVVGEVTRADVDRAAESYRRRLVLWDNFPVNDFEPSRLFLGPLTGRTSNLAEAALDGVIANAMIEAAPSRIPLATVAEWARDPAAYDGVQALGRALVRLGAEHLSPLVRVCSAWPPSADQDPELSAAVAGALAGDDAAARLLAHRLAELASCCRTVEEPAELVAALRPWLVGGLATAEAGLAALRLLRGEAGETPASVRAALSRAESHYENVLRPLVPSFVRAVLDRCAPADVARGPLAALVCGPSETPGDRATREFLEQCGFAVRRTVEVPDGCAVVVVTRSADRERLGAIAGAPVPVVAWNGLVELGMAGASSTVMLREPLALPDGGALAVYRGPAWSTVADVGGDAQVLAREAETGRAAVFRYATGDRLANGSTAAATRVGLFLGRDGPAPWLLSEAGRSMVAELLPAASG